VRFADRSLSFHRTEYFNARISITVAGMRGTSTGTDAQVMTTMAIEAGNSVRSGAVLLVACLLLTPYIAARAAENVPHESSISTHAKSFGAAVKRDAMAVSAGCKEGAHWVAVAAKSVVHEIAIAAKRGAAETRAAFRGENVKTPAT
jgi:hypothetical protein